MDIDDLELVVTTQVETTSRHELKRQFYRFHKKTEEMWGSKTAIKTLNPIAVTDDTAEDRDRWIAVYYRRFYVTLDQGTTITRGPHTAKLYYRGATGGIWLGTCQIVCNFYDAKRLRRKLRLAIRRKDYFCTHESGLEEFETTSPSEEIYSHQEDKAIRIKKKGRSGACVFLRAPKLTCPICKKARRTAGSLRRHLRIAHKRTLVYWHKLALPGLTKGR